MAEFHSFAGLRYNCEKVNLSDVICPPYDVIKGAARDELIARDPHNIVQVELATYYGQDGTDEQYAKCAEILNGWRNDGTLVQDDPAFYLYEQEFAVPVTSELKKRRGVLGALQLEEFGEGVKPHEHTLSGPKQDRLKLLRAVRTNTSPIFGLYDDNDGWVAKLLEDVTFEAPTCQATDNDGVTHRLWRITDDETVNAIVAALQDEPIFIADGHHRYETALNFMKEEKARIEAEGGTWTGGEPANRVLMMCVSTDDDGLVVLPTHRLIKNVSTDDVAKLQETLAAHFDMEAVSAEGSTEDQARALMGRVNAPSDTPQIGVHIDGQSYLLKLREGDAHLQHMESDKSEAYNSLDVSILHTLILEKQLGIGADKLAAGQHVSYTINPVEAMEKVNSGEYSVAFLLRPTPTEQVQAVAAAGDKMPQKSTYFYPKLYTGLVLRSLD